MYGLLTALFLAVAPVSAGSAVDRCVTNDCTCEVRENPSVKSFTKYSRLVVTFDEDSDMVSPRERQRIDTFLRSSHGPLYLFGYADQCGDPGHNADLSRRRTQNVSDIVGRRVFSARYYGESVSETHTRHDRKVVISARPDYLTAALEAYEVDVYLFDASGSMRPYWDQIEHHDFPAGSDIYVSKMEGCSNGQSVTSLTPSGGTEIWYSYYHVLQQMKPGQSLLIVSDFDSNVPLTSGDRRAIEALVRSKQIKVYTLTY